MKNETLTAILNEKDKLSAYMGVGVDYYKGETGKSGADEVYIGPEPPTDPEVKLWVDTEDQSLDVVDWNDVENKPNFATVATSGSYNDLTDKPVIPEAPDLTPYATESWVEGKGYTTMTEVEAKGYLTEHQDLSTYALKSEIPSLTGYAKTADLSTVATSGSYNDLTDKPTIPEAPDLTNYATKDDLANAKPDLTPYAKTADLSTVATTGSYEDLTNKPTIPDAYTLPTASTDTLGGVKVDGETITITDGVISSTQPTKTSELTNDSGFITNEYHDATKQNKLEAGDNITIADDGTISASHPAKYVDGANATENTLNLYFNNGTSVTFTPTGGSGGGSGGSEPDAYLKSASVSGNTLTLTNKDNTTVVFTPTGGSGGGSYTLPTASTDTLGGVKVDGTSITIADGVISSAAGGLIGKKMKDYNQPESEWGWIADWAQHPEKYYVVIEGISDTSKDCPVIYTVVYGKQFYYYWFEGNTLHERYITFTDNTLSQVESVNQWADSGTVWLTQQNWQDYITAGGGSDWQVTTSTSDGNLYNAKEVVIFWQDSNYNRHQSYLNVGCDYYGNSGNSWGNSNWLNTEIRLDSIDDVYNGSSITYDGSNVNTANIASINAILYKT